MFQTQGYFLYEIKAINIPPQIGAHIAHGINAYNESCRKHKKEKINIIIN